MERRFMIDNYVNSENTGGNKKYFRAINYILPIYPIIAQYDGLVISVGVTVMTLYSILILVKAKRLTLYMPFIVFSLFAIAMQFTQNFILPGCCTTYNNGNLKYMLVVVFIIASTWGLIDTDILYRVYRLVGLIVLIVLFIQAYQYYILGHNVYPWAFVDISGKNFWYSLGNRPSAFFAEPQALCSFLLPLLYLCLKKKEMWLAVIIVLACIISTSSLGIIISVTMIGVNIFFIRHIITKEAMFIFLFVASVTALILINGVLQSSYAFQKIEGINISDDVRLTRGFQIYGSFPGDKKITGVGMGNLPEYLVYNKNIRFGWMNLVRQDAWGYANAIASSFLYFGLFGGILFIYFIFSLAKYCRNAYLPMYTALIMLTFTTSIMMDSWFIFFFVFFFGMLAERGEIKTSILFLGKRK